MTKCSRSITLIDNLIRDIDSTITPIIIPIVDLPVDLPIAPTKKKLIRRETGRGSHVPVIVNLLKPVTICQFNDLGELKSFERNTIKISRAVYPGFCHTLELLKKKKNNSKTNTYLICPYYRGIQDLQLAVTGKAKYGEKICSAAAREVAEEIGLVSNLPNTYESCYRICRKKSSVYSYIADFDKLDGLTNNNINKYMEMSKRGDLKKYKCQTLVYISINKTEKNSAVMEKKKKKFSGHKLRKLLDEKDGNEIIGVGFTNINNLDTVGDSVYFIS